AMKPQVHPSPSSADRCPWRIGRILLRTGLAAAWGMATGPGFAATHSGRVADVDGSRVEGVTVRYEWSGSPGSVTTAANGNWSSSGWGPLQQARWRASMSGYTFEPNPTVWYTTPLIGNITGINFTRYTGVSGRVLRDGAGLSGVRVGLSGPAGRSDETGADGAYNFKQLGTGAYTITPSRPGTIFEPPSRAVTLGTNRSVPDFVVRLPSILTLPATNVGFGDAVLRGTVEGAGGQATTVWFEHGRVGGPLTSTPAQTLPAASATVQFSEAVTGLPGGSQEFRLVGVNASGTNRSAPGHFVMPYPAAGSAVRFNGTDAYVQVGSNPILRLTNSLTLEAWILATGPGNGPNGTGGIIVNREGEYEIARFADGTIRYALAPASGGWDWVNTGVAVPLHVWTHVALTYDPAAASAQLRLFLNGEPRFATNRTGVIGDTDTGRNDFRIGSRQGAVQHFQGQMDEVRVWNVARTAAEIQGGYRRRLAGTEGGLLASFRFDEASGTTTTDHGPNRLGATLVGASFAPSGAEIREPVVRTLEASPVLATRATLHARVNPSDAVTGVYFEYGETPAYGRRTDAQPASLAGGLKELPVGAEVADLQPGTTYHFRAVAFNEFGAVPGPGRSFRTLVLGVGWPTSAKVTGGWSDAPKHVVDAEGSAYVAGRFAGSVGKLGRGADWLWANQVIAHAGSSVAIQAIAVDAARNVHVAGAFSGTVSLGTNQLAAPAGSTNLFVAKL
ncbi:MAG TPA: hypothetical protein PKE47_12250, partial [Verrucomicrobiota bacterium]|nr:hypothetical protein [Verrucomicrobiota bacterium]